MTSIEEFLENPGEKDVKVSEVFTEKMFGQLERRMESVGWPEVRSFWEGEFRDQKIVEGFMKVSMWMFKLDLFLLFLLAYN